MSDDQNQFEESLERAKNIDELIDNLEGEINKEDLRYIQNRTEELLEDLERHKETEQAYNKYLNDLEQNLESVDPENVYSIVVDGREGSGVKRRHIVAGALGTAGLVSITVPLIGKYLGFGETGSPDKEDQKNGEEFKFGTYRIDDRKIVEGYLEGLKEDQGGFEHLYNTFKGGTTDGEPPIDEFGFEYLEISHGQKSSSYNLKTKTGHSAQRSISAGEAKDFLEYAQNQSFDIEGALE